MFETALLIGGAWVAAQDGKTYERLDPVNSLPVTRAAAASVKDAVAAANAAAAAFGDWSCTSAEERRRVLERAADLLRQRQPEFAAAMADEIGAADSWVQFNCELASAMLRDAATLTDWLTETRLPSAREGVTALAIRQPAGVVLGIAPWNAPVVLGVRALAAPLACGNTVVLKASELCPKTHALIAEVLVEAGIPPGTVNLVSNAPENAPEIVEALVAHEAVRRVNFTGSTRVGRIIGSLCAHYIKPSLLELSGKAPMLVLDDADIDEAVKAAAFGAFFNQGQICISTERIVVDQRVADEFLEKFTARAATLVAGDPRSNRYPLGSLISREAAQRISALIEDAVEKGARLVAGGGSDNTLMPATVLDGVTSSMRIYREESFGPVAAVVRVAGVEEAIAVANDTEFGLVAAVFGKDVERALHVARRIESGICHINASTVYDEPQMPFGGIKASGYGRFGGEAGVNEFTDLRWVSIHQGKHNYPI